MEDIIFYALIGVAGISLVLAAVFFVLYFKTGRKMKKLGQASETQDDFDWSADSGKIDLTQADIEVDQNVDAVSTEASKSSEDMIKKSEVKKKSDKAKDAGDDINNIIKDILKK